jgi:hypothetical protein
MGHQVVNDGPPEPNARFVSLKIAGIEEQVKRFFLPSFASVLVTTQTGQQLCTSTERRQIMRAAMRRKEIGNLGCIIQSDL